MTNRMLRRFLCLGILCALLLGTVPAAGAQDGITDLCVYHARQYDEIIGDPLYDPNRHAMVMKVEYDEKGFPVFSYENNIEMN